MKTETTYDRSELKHGKCSSCDEQSKEILVGTTKCVDCIEADRFYEETMSGLDEYCEKCHAQFEDECACDTEE